jgi:ABC-type transport system involved in cytochrome c biogenesis permease subunit
MNLGVVSSLTMGLAMVCLAAATVLYAYHFVAKRPSASFYASFMTGVAFVSLTASIGLHSSVVQGTRIYGPYSLVLAAWALVVVYFAVEHLIRLKVYGTVLVPLALLALVVAQLMGAGSVGPNPSPVDVALFDSWRVGVHVALVVFANAGFFIGGVASAAYHGLEAQLKAHRTSTLFKRLPSLGQTDSIARRAIVFAYPAYSGGLLLGVLRAIEEQDKIGTWWLDPRIMLSGIVWLIFGAYLYMRYGRNISARTSAIVAIVGVFFVIALAIVARTPGLTGFHIFGIAS